MTISEPKKKKIKKQIYFTATGEMNFLWETQEFILSAGKECAEKNPKIKCTKPDYCFGSFLTLPKIFKSFKFKYCQAVNKKGKETDLIKFETIPATDVLAFECVGPYKKLKKAYKLVLNWLEINNIPKEKINGPLREVYIDGPWNKENPKEYRTEIQVPIKK